MADLLLIEFLLFSFNLVFALLQMISGDSWSLPILLLNLNSFEIGVLD